MENETVLLCKKVREEYICIQQIVTTGASHFKKVWLDPLYRKCTHDFRCLYHLLIPRVCVLVENHNYTRTKALTFPNMHTTHKQEEQGNADRSVPLYLQT